MSRQEEFTQGSTSQNLVTPEHLRAIVSHYAATTRLSESIDRYKNSSHASGDCMRSAAQINKWLPVGSQVVQYDGGKRGQGYTNHFVNHVPTTEGIHVVDLTHKQFSDRAPHKLVEPIEKFHSRSRIKKFGALKIPDKVHPEYTQSRYSVRGMTGKTKSKLRGFTLGNDYDPPSSPIPKSR